MLFWEEVGLLFLGDGHPEFFHGGEHVFPELAFHVVGATALEEVAGVVGDACGDAGDFVPLAAHGGDGAVEADEAFRGGASEGDDDLWADDGDFREDEGQAGGHFLGGGFAVVGGLLR